MNAIAISNRRPEFVPLSMRSIAIAGQRNPAFRPAPFHSSYERHLSQAPPPAPPAIPANLSEEDAAKMAGKLMNDSGQKVLFNLNSVINQYSGQGSWWLGEAAASFFAFGPAGPVGVALDTWWQGSRANQALAKLSAIQRLANAWVMSMSETWLPAFSEKIDKYDKALGDKIDVTFRQVTAAMAKVTTAMKDVSELPPAVVQSMISTFFGSLKSDLDATAKTLLALLEALGSVMRGAAAVVAAAPMAVVIVGLGALIYFTTK